MEFAGRRNLGEVAKLYMKMEKENTMKEKVAWEFLTVAGIEETIQQTGKKKEPKKRKKKSHHERTLMKDQVKLSLPQ